MTKPTVPKDDRIYHYANYTSNLIQTKGSDYISKNREEVDNGFKEYYAQQIRISELKKQILSPLKELLPTTQYNIVETIIRRTDIKMEELEKLVLPEDDIGTLWNTLLGKNSEVQSDPSLKGR